MPPRCHCGGSRPAIVWFGESLDRPTCSGRRDRADVFVTVGTSAVVYPAAGFVHYARTRGAFTAEINLTKPLRRPS